MRFMITATWKQAPTEEILALIPAEEARVKELEEQGIQESIYFAADQSVVWGVWNCLTLGVLQDTLQTLPLYKYLNIDISPLVE